MVVQHPRPANVVVLRRGLGEACRDLLGTAGARLDEAVGELDRVLCRVGDRVDATIHAGRVAIRAGKLAFEQERRRERVRGPLGLVAGYKPSNNR